MPDQPPPAALDRIERAIARVAAASASDAAAHRALKRRHAALRDRVGEAIASLDALLDPSPKPGAD